MAFTVAELADKWRCSPKHIYSLINSGELKCFMVGKTRGMRIAEEEVERWQNDMQNARNTETETSSSDSQTVSGSQITQLAKLASARG